LWLWTLESIYSIFGLTILGLIYGFIIYLVKDESNPALLFIITSSAPYVNDAMNLIGESFNFSTSDLSWKLKVCYTFIGILLNTAFWAMDEMKECYMILDPHGFVQISGVTIGIISNIFIVPFFKLLLIPLAIIPKLTSWILDTPIINGILASALLIKLMISKVSLFV
jgi:hypothetical protein